MIFPDKRRRTVEIRKNHIDHKKVQKQQRRRKISVSLLLVAVLLAGGVYVRADRKIIDGVTYLKNLQA